MSRELGGESSMSKIKSEKKERLEEIERLHEKIAILEARDLERQKAIADLAAAQEHYRVLVEGSLAGFYIIQDGAFQYLNERAARIFGYNDPEELLGKPFWIFVHPDDREMVKQRGVRRQEAHVSPSRYALRGLRRDGKSVWVEVDGRNGVFRGRPANIGSLIDISGMKWAEKAHQQELERQQSQLEEMVTIRTRDLQETKQRLEIEIEDRKEIHSLLLRERNFAQSVIESLPGLFYVFDRTGKVVDWNRSAEKLLGYTGEQLSKMHALDLVATEDKATIAKAIEETFRQSKVNTEGVLVSADGERTPYLLTGVACQLQGASYLVGVGVDITQQKHVEQELRQSERQLRELSERLLATQEMERRRLARELHDGIGQSLTGIKFLVERTCEQLKDCPHCGTAQHLHDLVPALQGVVQEIRRISRNLWPTILEDLGILDTLSVLCGQFESFHGNIAVRQEVDIDEADVPPSLKIIVYRIVQEALNNVAKHARAREVSIRLHRSPEGLELVICDDGLGFDVDGVNFPDESKRGLGLASIRERIGLSAGTFQIETSPGLGTCLRALWPKNGTHDASHLETWPNPSKDETP
jgi:PAS domain S-box-containing protein